MFMVFGPGGHDHDSQTQLYLILGTPNDSNWYKKKSRNISTKCDLGKSQNIGSPANVIFGKDGDREILKIRLINSWKSWKWDQYLPTAWNGYFLKFWNMGSRSSRKHEIEILNMGSISSRKHGMDYIILQLDHFNFILISQIKELKHLICLFSIKGIPTTPQNSDSHPCTSPPLVGHEKDLDLGSGGRCGMARQKGPGLYAHDYNEQKSMMGRRVRAGRRFEGSVTNWQLTAINGN